MTNIIAAIPVKNNLKWTAQIIEQLLLGDNINELWIYDNGSIDETRMWVENRSKYSENKLKYFDASSMKFYEMWNHMIKRASSIKGTKLAILNNDIRLPGMALKAMAENMYPYKIAQVDGRRNAVSPVLNPTAVEIRWTERIGHAFMLDCDFWSNEDYAIDPRLLLWFGDDDLFLRCANRGGKICEIQGVGCDHAWHESYKYYSNVHGNIDADIDHDRKIFLSNWKNIGIDKKL